MKVDDSVFVRRQWNDWRIASVPASALDEVHWGRASGGVRVRSPRFFLQGYVWCDKLDGDIAHSCLHGDAPHRIKVCIVGKDNNRQVMMALEAKAGPRPSS